MRATNRQLRAANVPAAFGFNGDLVKGEKDKKVID
jgi:hypothetical protein